MHIHYSHVSTTCLEEFVHVVNSQCVFGDDSVIEVSLGLESPLTHAKVGGLHVLHASKNRHETFRILELCDACKCIRT